MLSRSALAASITFTATLVSGMAAFAATTDSNGFASETASAASVATARSGSGMGSPTGDTGVPAPAGSGISGPSTVGAKVSPAALWAAAVAAGQPGTGGSAGTTSDGTQPPADDSPGRHHSPPATTPTSGPTNAPSPTTSPPNPPSTNPPPFNCSGSVDGLSEAYKHAREQYCHGQGRE